MITVTTRDEFLIALKGFMPQHCYGVEIGVLKGEFTKKILDIIQPTKLLLVDPFDIGGKPYKSGLTTAYSNEEDYKLLNQLAAEDNRIIIDRLYSFAAVINWSDNSFNFIYHDASHLYEDVKRDMNDWLPKVKENGIIAGHDYVELDNFGVIEAVDEFIKEHGFEMLIFNENGGDWALKKI